MRSPSQQIRSVLDREYIVGKIYRIDVNHVDVIPAGSAGILRGLPLVGDRDKAKIGDSVRILTISGRRTAVLPDAPVYPRVEEGVDEKLLDEMRVAISDILKNERQAIVDEGPGIEVSGSTVAVGLDSVLVAYADGSPASEHANIAEACARAGYGDIVWVGRAGIFSGDFTVPSGVAVVGLGREQTIIDGTVTLSSGSSISNLSIIRDVNSPAQVAGVIGPNTGRARILNCVVEVHNSNGDAAALATPGGGICDVENCRLVGQSGNGDGYAVLNNPSEIVNPAIIQNHIFWIAPDSHMASGGFGPGPGYFWGSAGGTGGGYSALFYSFSFFYDKPLDLGRLDLEIELFSGPLRIARVRGTDVDPTAAPDLDRHTSPKDFDVGISTLQGAGPYTYPGNETRYFGIRLSNFNPWSGSGRIRRAWWNEFGVITPLWETIVSDSTAEVYLRDCHTQGILDATYGGIFLRDVEYDREMIVGSVIPMVADRSVWDAAGSKTLHANDIDTADGVHHTLGTGPNQAAPGDHNHTELNSGEAPDGYVLTADGSGGVSWEPNASGGHVIQSEGENLPTRPILNFVGLSVTDDPVNEKTIVEAQDSSLDDLTDVQITSPLSGQVLKYNGTAWVNAADDQGNVSSLDDLTDVEITAPQAGQVLKFNGETWINESINEGNIGSLDELDDVEITSPQLGQALRYNGETWVNQPVSEVGSLDDLSDVVINAPQTGQVLKFDGQSWVNETVDEGGGHAIQDEGSPLPQRQSINFVGSGVTVTDDELNNRTVVTIPGSGSTISLQAIFTASGELAVGSNPLRIYNATGVDKTISKVFLGVSTPPAGSAIIVDVNMNGSTIFTDQANRPQISDGSYTGETTNIDISTWSAGSYLTVDIDQVGSGTAGSDLTVHIVYV